MFHIALFNVSWVCLQAMKSQISLNPKRLYQADLVAVKELLKIARYLYGWPARLYAFPELLHAARLALHCRAPGRPTATQALVHRQPLRRSE